METLAIRTKQRRKALGLTQPALAKKVGVSTSAIQWVEYGRTKDPTFLVELAQALDVDPNWLKASRNGIPSTGRIMRNDQNVTRIGNQNDASLFIPTGAEMPDLATLPADLPLLEVSSHGEVDMFEINWEAGDKMRRPPGFAFNSKAFATYVYGNHMYPRFDQGAKIAVNPGQPPGPGDDVIIEFRGGGNVLPGRCVIRHLISLSSTTIVAEQFNPAERHEYDAEDVSRVMRIVPWPELLSG